MKFFPVISLIITTITIATILHAVKINGETDDMDKMSLALKGIEKVLPATANISIQSLGGPDNRWFYCRYLLVPRHCVLYRPVLDSSRKFDTLLTITSFDASDSIVHTITDYRKIIWENKDKQYKYYLTCNRR
jgi:hypothetical protein